MGAGNTRPARDIGQATNALQNSFKPVSVDDENVSKYYSIHMHVLGPAVRVKGSWMGHVTAGTPPDILAPAATVASNKLSSSPAISLTAPSPSSGSSTPTDQTSKLSNAGSQKNPLSRVKAALKAGGAVQALQKQINPSINSSPLFDMKSLTPGTPLQLSAANAAAYYQFKYKYLSGTPEDTPSPSPSPAPNDSATTSKSKAALLTKISRENPSFVDIHPFFRNPHVLVYFPQVAEEKSSPNLEVPGGGNSDAASPAPGDVVQPPQEKKHVQTAIHMRVALQYTQSIETASPPKIYVLRLGTQTILLEDVLTDPFKEQIKPIRMRANNLKAESKDMPVKQVKPAQAVKKPKPEEEEEEEEEDGSEQSESESQDRTASDVEVASAVQQPAMKELFMECDLKTLEDPYAIIVASTDDIEGSFVLRLQAIVKHYSVRIPKNIKEWFDDDDLPEMHTASGEWKGFHAGGSPLTEPLNWINNPQYPLYIAKPTQAMVIIEAQSVPKQKLEPIGFLIVTPVLPASGLTEGKKEDNKIIRYNNPQNPNIELVGRSRIPFTPQFPEDNRYEVSCRVFLEPREVPYFIVPYAETYGLKRPFAVTVLSDVPLNSNPQNLKVSLPTLSTRTLKSEWISGKAGGVDLQDDKFYLNPHFIMVVNPKTENAIFSSLQDPGQTRTHTILQLQLLAEVKGKVHLILVKTANFRKEETLNKAKMQAELDRQLKSPQSKSPAPGGAAPKPPIRDTQFLIKTAPNGNGIYELEDDILPGDYTIVAALEEPASEQAKPEVASKEKPKPIPFQVTVIHSSHSINIRLYPSSFNMEYFDIDETFKQQAITTYWKEYMAAGEPPASLMNLQILGNVIPLDVPKLSAFSLSDMKFRKPIAHRFLDNPQFALKIPKSDKIEKTRTQITLMRHDNSLSRISFYLFRAPNGECKRLEEVSESMLVGKFEPSEDKRVSEKYIFLNTDLMIKKQDGDALNESDKSEEAVFIIVPCNSDVGHSCEFSVIIDSDQPVNFSLLEPCKYNVQKYQGEWHGGITGGDETSPFLRNTPKYSLKLRADKSTDQQSSSGKAPLKQASASSSAKKTAMFTLKGDSKLPHVKYGILLFKKSNMSTPVAKSTFTEHQSSLYFDFSTLADENEYEVVVTTDPDGVEAGFHLDFFSTPGLDADLSPAKPDDFADIPLPYTQESIARWAYDRSIFRISKSRGVIPYVFELTIPSDPTLCEIDIFFNTTSAFLEKEGENTKVSKLGKVFPGKRWQTSFIKKKCMLKPQKDPYMFLFDLTQFDPVIVFSLKANLLVPMVRVKTSHPVTVEETTVKWCDYYVSTQRIPMSMNKLVH